MAVRLKRVVIIVIPKINSPFKKIQKEMEQDLLSAVTSLKNTTTNAEDHQYANKVADWPKLSSNTLIILD